MKLWQTIYCSDDFLVALERVEVEGIFERVREKVPAQDCPVLEHCSPKFGSWPKNLYV